MFFLAIQSTYDAVEVGFFSDRSCLESRTIPKTKASAALMPTIDDLFESHSMKPAGIDFVVVSQGPGPFTTLRTVLSTTNGYAYATGVPLIGVNALEVLVYEYQANHPDHKNVCALLHAFGNDVYVGYSCPTSRGQNFITSALSLEEYAKWLATWSPNDLVVCIGNGVALHYDRLHALRPTSIFDTTYDHSTLQSIADVGYGMWVEGYRGREKIMPLYLKDSITI